MVMFIQIIKQHEMRLIKTLRLPTVRAVYLTISLLLPNNYYYWLMIYLYYTQIRNSVVSSNSIRKQNDDDNISKKGWYSYAHSTLWYTDRDGQFGYSGSHHCTHCIPTHPSNIPITTYHVIMANTTYEWSMHISAFF